MVASPERILVPVDDSEASEKAVAYLARILSGTSDCTVRLFHVVEPVGPYWESMHGDLHREPRASGRAEVRLVDQARRRSRPVLERMTEILTDARIDPERIESSWFTAAREDSLPHEVLELARTQGYHTVVVGRTAMPWTRELFHRHLAESLVKKGQGLSVWVVE